jgi:hypothetical protein
LKLGDIQGASLIFPALGRRTNSPPQFGHTAAIASVQPRQNVHS